MARQGVLEAWRTAPRSLELAEGGRLIDDAAAASLTLAPHSARRYGSWSRPRLATRPSVRGRRRPDAERRGRRRSAATPGGPKAGSATEVPRSAVAPRRVGPYTAPACDKPAQSPTAASCRQRAPLHDPSFALRDTSGRRSDARANIAPSREVRWRSLGGSCRAQP